MALDDTRSAIWEKDSLVGSPPMRTAEANMLPWLPGALVIVGYSETEYEKLVTKLGRQAAAEVVLLMVTRRGNAEDAKRLGCPWLFKTWGALRKLEETYNQWAIGQPSIDERAVLSDSPRPKADDEQSLPGSMIGRGTASHRSHGAVSYGRWAEPLHPDLLPHDTPAETEVPPAKVLKTNRQPMSLPPRKQGPYDPKGGLFTHRTPVTTQQPDFSWPTAMQASKSKAMSKAAPKAPAPKLRPRPLEPFTLKTGVPITRKQIHDAHIVLKSATQHCRFTHKPIYWCECQPNQWNLKWVYSVPCGEAPGVCNEHIFLNDADIVDKGGDMGTQTSSEMAIEWLSQLGWHRITRAYNQWFQCPKHRHSTLIW